MRALCASATAGLIVFAVAAAPAAADDFYCNEWVPPYSACDIHLNTTPYEYNANQAYAQHGNGIAVCEKVTIRYQAPNISRRCGPIPVDSQCDLGAYAGNSFSMYTGNNTFTNIFMVGKAFNQYCD